MEGDGRSDRVESFIGQSPEAGDTEEPPSLMKAIDRAATAAGEAGQGGKTYEVAVEVEVNDHNQWIKTMRVIITPHH